VRKFFLILGLIGLLAATVAGGALGARAPVTAKPSKVNFGRVAVNTISAPKQIVVTNTSKTTIYIQGGTVIDTNQFQLDATACVGNLAPGASCTATATFLPQTQGKLTGTGRFLWQDSSDDYFPLDVSLVGTGI
jgi:hypothetical protein